MNRLFKKQLIFTILIFVGFISIFLVGRALQNRQGIRPKAERPVNNIFVNPEVSSVAPNTNFNIGVFANIGAYRFNAGQVKLSFNPVYLTVENCTLGTGFEGIAEMTPCLIDNILGSVTLTLQSQNIGDTAPTGSVMLGNINFKSANQLGSAAVNFTTYNLAVDDLTNNTTIDFAIQGAYGGTYEIATVTQPPATVTVTLPPATVTVTPPPTTITLPPVITQPPTPQQGNVIINFRLKFQGVAAKRDDKTVAFTLVGGPGNIRRDFPNVPIVSDAGGSWFGSITTDVPLGDGYLVLVKGPMHLKRKYCDADPTPVSESADYHCGSQGQIRLVAGVNQLDFRRTIIYIGDLPPQDGEMNARDASELRLNLTKTDADALSRADVNFDGIVNTTDWSLIIESMQVNFDEEI